MIKRVFAIVAFCCSVSSFVFASMDSVVCRLTDTEGRYREHNCDFTHISLDVRFVPKEGRVIGKETLEFTPIQPLIDSLYLDAPGITIKKVLLDKAIANVSFESTKLGVIVRFPTQKLKWEEKHSLYIEYEATPRKGLYFIGWNDEKNLSRKQIWTQGQGVDNRFWFPCYDDADDKAVTETTVTFDKAYTVVSNGALIDTKINADSTKTWHYAMSMPHSPYLVMLAIDKYAYKDYKSDNGIVSRQYYYADHPEVEASTYDHSKEVMDWLSKEIGVPYPWKSYSNTPVQDFMFGAMENTTTTIYGDFYQLDRRAIIERPYLGTNAHELTHQWFGDYITEYSATHHWLHESFATYYSKIFLRHVYGEDHYQWAMRGEVLQAIQSDRENRFPVAHSKGGTARHYSKGSFVIGMLRYVVGDEVYRKSIIHYLKKHALDNVDTHDFYRTFMETAGINLDWFFDEWIYHSGAPAYSVRHEERGDSTVFYVEQVHATDSLIHYFRMPIVFEVDYADHSRDSVRVMVSHHYDTIVVPNKKGKTVAYTLFDPGYNILKTIRLTKSYSELLAQARDARNMIDRYDAVQSMRDTLMEKKKADLIALFDKEGNYNVRSEIVHQLRGEVDADGIALLSKALKDTSYNVRRAVVDNVENIPRALLREYEALLSDTSYVTIESTLKKLVKQYPENKERYLKAVSKTIGISKNVRVAYLELRCADSLDVYKNELIDYTSHSYEFRTRVRAMEALERLSYINERMMGNIFDAMLNSNTRLAGPAERVLKRMMKKPEVKDIATAYYKKIVWKGWQQEKLKPILE